MPFDTQAYNIPALSSAIFTPLYVSPTQLGIMPGYYNSATGLVVTALPRDDVYVQYGLYDGNLAAGRQTGLEGPTFNEYKLHLVEAGADWVVGPQAKPGKVGVGYWRQTGLLSTPSGSVRGAEGVYLFASQRLYYERPGTSNNGISVWTQFAATDSDFISTHRYFGWGLTYFGPLPGRADDSAGYALAYGEMNDDPAAGLGPREVISTCYYQYQLRPGCYLQPNLTYISTPAASPGLDDVFAVTLRIILLF